VVGGEFRRKPCGGVSVLVVTGRAKGGEITEGKCSAWSYGASTIPRKEERGRGGESGHGYGRKTVSGAGEPPRSRGGRSAPVGLRGKGRRGQQG
jgi:hypothetical protein